MKQLIIGLVVLLVVGGGGYYLYTQNNGQKAPIDQGINTQTSADQETTNPSTEVTSATTSATSTGVALPKVFSMADIASHNGKASCYTAIRGNIYDLTDWISKHPGGEGAILSICGKDGTTAFVNQHGGKGRPEATLASFKIGVLSK